jgi:hypothetical protein
VHKLNFLFHKLAKNFVQCRVKFALKSSLTNLYKNDNSTAYPMHAFKLHLHAPNFKIITMNDLAYLSKQEVMRLFNIRDRTFYSWIEKEILFTIDGADGQKRYDVSKALKLKNINSADVTSLLAAPANVIPEEEEENEIIIEKPNLPNELVSNLKNQLETLKVELSEERLRSEDLKNKMRIFDSQQKLIGEVRANENQLMELAQKRENNLMAVFQERMKEIIVLSQENENIHYDKILESVKQVQSEREKSLKGIFKISLIFVGVLFFFIVFVGYRFYHNQDIRIDDLKTEKENLLKKTFEKEELAQNEIKKNAERMLALHQEHEKEIKIIDENNQKKIEAEKQTLSSFYTQNIKNLEKQLESIAKEKNSIKDDKDELRIQIQILELKFKNVLDELLNEKKSNTMATKDLDGLRKSLIEINDSLNKLREKSSAQNITPAPVLEAIKEPTPIVTPAPDIKEAP